MRPLRLFLICLQLQGLAQAFPATPEDVVNPPSVESFAFTIQAIPPVLTHDLTPILQDATWFQNSREASVLRQFESPSNAPRWVRLATWGGLAWIVVACPSVPVEWVGLMATLSVAPGPDERLFVSQPQLDPYMSSAQAREVSRVVNQLADREAGGKPKETGIRVTLGTGDEAIDLESARNGPSIGWSLLKSIGNLSKVLRLAHMPEDALRPGYPLVAYGSKTPAAVKRGQSALALEATPGLYRYLQAFESNGDLATAVKELGDFSLVAGNRGELAFGILGDYPVGFATSPFPEGSVVEVRVKVFDQFHPQLGAYLELQSPQMPLVLEARFTATEGRVEAIPTTAKEALWSYARDVLAKGSIQVGTWILLSRFQGLVKMEMGQADRWRLPFIGKRLPEIKLKGVPAGESLGLKAALKAPGDFSEGLMFEARRGPDLWQVEVTDSASVFTTKKIKWPARNLRTADAAVASYVEAFWFERDLAKAARLLPESFQVRLGHHHEIFFGQTPLGPLRRPGSSFPSGTVVTVYPRYWDPAKPELGVYFHLEGAGITEDLRLTQQGGYLEPIPRSGEEALWFYLRTLKADRDLSLDTWILLNQFPLFDIKPQSDGRWQLPALPGFIQHYPIFNPRGLRGGERPQVKVHPSVSGDLAAGLYLEIQTPSKSWTVALKRDGRHFRVMRYGVGHELFTEYFRILQNYPFGSERDRRLSLQARRLIPFKVRYLLDGVPLVALNDVLLRPRLPGVAEGTEVLVTPICDPQSARSDIYFELRVGARVWTARPGLRGNSVEFDVAIPWKHASLSIEEMRPFIASKPFSSAALGRVVQSLKSQIASKVVDMKVRLGTRIAIGTQGLEFTWLRLGLGENWTFPRSRLAVGQMLQAAENEGLAVRPADLPEFNPLVDVSITDRGARESGISPQAFARVRGVLGVPKAGAPSKWVAREGRMFPIGISERSGIPVWRFPWAHRAEMAETFGFYLPPEADEIPLDAKTLQKLGLDKRTSFRLMLRVWRFLHPMAQAPVTPQLIGEGTDAIPVFTRLTNRQLGYTIKADHLTRLPKAVNFPDSVQFPTVPARFLPEPRFSFSVLPGMDAFNTAFQNQRDLSDTFADLPAVFELPVDVSGRVFFGTWQARPIVYASQFFVPGSRVQVRKKMWDMARPQLGGYFELQHRELTISVRLCTTGGFLELLPESGPAALRAYLVDLLGGRDLTLASWFLLHRFPQLQPAFAKGGRWSVAEINGQSLGISLPGLKAGEAVECEVLPVDAQDERKGVTLKITTRDRGWTIELLRTGRVFRSRPLGRLRPRPEGLLQLLAHLHEINRPQPDLAQIAKQALLLTAFTRRARKGLVDLIINRTQRIRILLPDVREGERVTFEPIVDAAHADYGAFYKISYRDKVVIGHPRQGAPYLEILEDGAHVHYHRQVRIKTRTVQMTALGVTRYGYELRDPDTNQLETIWLVRSDTVRRATPQAIQAFIRRNILSFYANKERIEELMAKRETKASRTFLYWALRKLVKPGWSQRFFARAQKVGTDPRARAERTDPYADMLRRWLATSPAGRRIEDLEILGHLLESYLQRLFRSKQLRMALLANGSHRAPSGQVIPSFDVVMLRQAGEKHPFQIITKRLLTRLAIRAFLLHLRLQASFRIARLSVLDRNNRLLLHGESKAIIFRPVLYGDPELVEIARRAVVSRVRFGENWRDHWAVIQTRLRGVRNNGDQLPSLPEMIKIYGVKPVRGTENLPAFALLPLSTPADDGLAMGISLAVIGLMAIRTFYKEFKLSRPNLTLASA